MNNLLSYCGLIDLRMSASDKNLPVQDQLFVTLDYTYVLKAKFCLFGVAPTYYTFQSK
jgi:hypothetical protein